MTKKKILIVDDEPDILFTIEEICDFCGYEAFTTSAGDEAIRIAQVKKPDLMIVDYHMPGWDGLSIVKKIRELKLNLPILVLTVDEQQETADKFIAAGATDFSIKPIKAPDLIARIKVNLHIHDMQQQMLKKQEDIYREKGISLATLKLITEFLGDQDDEVTFEEITTAVNLAYQTVHRYIQYLQQHQLIIVQPIYGQLGRPKNKYRLIDHFNESML